MNGCNGGASGWSTRTKSSSRSSASFGLFDQRGLADLPWPGDKDQSPGRLVKTFEESVELLALVESPCR